MADQEWAVFSYKYGTVYKVQDDSEDNAVKEADLADGLGDPHRAMPTEEAYTLAYAWNWGRMSMVERNRSYEGS